MFEQFQSTFLNIIEDNRTSELKNVHWILWNTIPNANIIKRNLRKFQGFRQDELHQREVDTSTNLSKEECEEVCRLLGLEYDADSPKEDLIRKILEVFTSSKGQRASNTGNLVRPDHSSSRQSVVSINSRVSIQVDLCSQIEDIDRTLVGLIRDLNQYEDQLDNLKNIPSASNNSEVRKLERKINLTEAEITAMKSKKQRILRTLKEKDQDDHMSRPRSIMSRHPQDNLSRPRSVQTSSSHESEGEQSYTRRWVEHCQEFGNAENNPEQDMATLKNAVSSLVVRQSVGSKLSDFDGSTSLGWKNFLMKYRLTTKRCNISDEENILRLSQYLKGEAKDKVDLLLMSTKDPEQIIEILDSHYGGKRKLLKELISRSENVQDVDSLEKFTMLNCVVQNVSASVQNFENDLFDNQKLLGIFIDKLPEHIIMQWAGHLLAINVSSKDVKLDYFARWINSLSKVVTDVTFFSSRKNGQQPTNKREPDFMKREDTKSHPDSKSSSESKHCRVCNSAEHSVEKCGEFLKNTVTKRWEIAKKLNLCFCCLRIHGGKCRKRTECKIPNCGKFHHEALHKSREENNITATCYDPKVNVLLKMIPVKIKGPKGVLQVMAFLDEGSTLTLIDERLSDAIGLHGEKLPICFKWTGGIYRHEPEAELLDIEVSSISNEYFYKMKNVRSIPNLELPMQNIDMDKIFEAHPSLKNFNISRLREKPMLLIGQSDVNLIVSREVCEIDKGLIATKTRLGWTLHGPLEETSRDDSNFICCQTADETLEDMVHQYFEFENFGLLPELDPSSSCEEQAITTASSTIKRVGSQFEIGLPWKDKSIPLEDSRPLAFQRFYCLELKLMKDEYLFNCYKKQIEKLLQKGYAREIKFSDLQDRKVWFLPHFAVTNPKKPHKDPRIVFDAAAKVNKMSLNDYLLPGPDWLSSIIGILIRFREGKIAFAADIMEMFNRVNIIDEDTFAQCFLWRETRNDPVRVFQMKAMLFGLNCSPFLAQYVKNFNASNYKEEFPEAYTAIVRNHYVDDYLDSTNSEEEAIGLIKSVIHVHSCGGFQIRAFISNSEEVLKNLPSNLVDEKMFAEFNNSGDQKVLGLTWNGVQDCFKFHFHRISSEVMEQQQNPTKREVLKAVMSVYDPLGLITPVTLRGRMLMQDIWKTKTSWDEEIPSNLLQDWNSWLSQLKSVSKATLPRCYSSKQTELAHIELHIFNDASLLAHCSAAYFRYTFKDGSCTVSLVMAKAKVLPKSRKAITIPKMELIAAVTGTRLAKVISKETRLDVKSIHYWTDSSTVLYWLSNPTILKTFERNRVAEILDNSSITQWKWVPTQENVADLGTKLKKMELHEKSTWFTGPRFLLTKETTWNTRESRIQVPVEVADIMVISQVTAEIKDFLPEVNRFSRLSRLLRSTAWIGRFVNNLMKSKIKQPRTSGYLSVEEIDWAFHHWVRKVQSDQFSDDVKRAKNVTFDRENLRLIKQLTKMGEDDILRISGRIDKAERIPLEMKQPIILDGHHGFTKLFILDIHEKLHHFSIQAVINQFKRKFWMPKLVCRIKQIIHTCQRCKVKNSVEIQPQMGLLPEYRFLTREKCFTATGMDYFGPYSIKHGRKIELRYGVLFTCMTTRAIHIEIAHSLSTDSCVMAIRRMMSLHGPIRKMISDNGTNLRGASRDLLEALDDINPELMKEELVKLQIDWIFIPPGAPNFGGCWERLIGCFKKALSSVLSTNRNPTDEMLLTFMREVQYTINCRPYIIESSNEDDDFSPTPNDILIPHNIIMNPCGNFCDDLLSRKTWRVCQHFIDEFWNKFTNLYIPTLIERKKWTKPDTNLEVGDIVHIKDNFKRGEWPLGRVVKTFPGPDGNVRVVELKMGASTLKRPANKLRKLDVSPQEGGM